MNVKARCECEHCENVLLVHSKLTVSLVFSLLAVFFMSYLSAILTLSQPWDLIFVLGGAFLLVMCLYALLCRIKSPEFVYHVDLEDPTILERKKREKRK